MRSADTASGQKSIAEEFGLNYWNASDAYYYCVWFHPPTRWLRRLRPWAAGGDQAGLVGGDDQLGTIPGGELGQQVSDVGLNGLD